MTEPRPTDPVKTPRRGHATIALGVVGALVLTACGSNDSPRVTAGDVVTSTHRSPQIALFRSGAGGRYDIVIADDRGRHVHVLTGAARKGSVIPHLFTRLAWSPDGRRIAFAGVRGDDASGFRGDIYVMQANGRRQRRLTRLRDAFDPLWSPDGRMIVFTRLRFSRGTLVGALWAMRPDGSKLRQLTPSVNGQSDRAGSFLPDGSQLAFTRTTCAAPDQGGCITQTSALFLAKPDGSDERKLLDRASDPAFSPDGRRIAFVSDRDENGQLNYGDRDFFANELYVMNADGTDQRRLTRSAGLNERSPSWLPAGTRIAFQRGKQVENAEGTSLFQINSNGTCEHKILADPRLDTWYAGPAWRPSTSRLARDRLSC